MNPDGPLSAQQAAPVNRTSSNRWAALLLGAVLLATFAHRMWLLLSTGFPINDGGLFYGFVQQIGAVFPALPENVSYNGLELPFAYPPLSFWIVALMSKLGVDTLAIFHVAPIVMNLAYIGLFALVLKRNGSSLMFVALTLLFFCSTLRSFEWLIMGGGIPRSLGALFLLATLLVVGTSDGKERRQLSTLRMITSGLFVAAAILTSLEWGINAAAVVILNRVLGSPSLKDFVRSLILSGTTAAVLISPWLYFVYAAHGLEPFLAAGASGQLINVFSVDGVLSIMMGGVINPLIPVGLALILYRKQFFWPAFFVMCFVLTPRHSETPAAMALAIFAATGTIWLFSRLERSGRRKPLALAVMAIFVSVVTIPHFDTNFTARGESVHALERPQLEAMKWVADNHRDTDFIVLEKYGWWSASSAEWFPVLTGARSTNTVQGREWLIGSYQKFYSDDIQLKVAIIRRMSRVLPKPSCQEIRGRLAVFRRPRFLWTEVVPECFPAPRFKPVYRNGPVRIYEITPDALQD